MLVAAIIGAPVKRRRTARLLLLREPTSPACGPKPQSGVGPATSAGMTFLFWTCGQITFFDPPPELAGSEYRGVVLPKGMPREFLDAGAKIIGRHQFFDCEDSDDECAVKVFLAVQEHQA